jgi:hypothetical protein
MKIAYIIPMYGSLNVAQSQHPGVLAESWLNFCTILSERPELVVLCNIVHIQFLAFSLFCTFTSWILFTLIGYEPVSRSILTLERNFKALRSALVEPDSTIPHTAFYG